MLLSFLLPARTGDWGAGVPTCRTESLTTDAEEGVHTVHGDTERDLSVEEYEGHRVLIQDGAILSVAVTTGDPPFGYWTAMLPEDAPRTALLLGLGAGTLAHLLTRRFPGVRIVGVDIDSRLIEFARSNFDLDLPNLDVVISDAFGYAAACRDRFDYVAVDLFCGHAFQRGALAKPFLRNLKAIAGPRGEVVVNLFKDRRSEVYVNRLARILAIRRVDRLTRNIVVHCCSEA
jgi:spermidine synthase